MKSSAKIAAVFVVCTLATLVSAETLTGTVKNGTTNQPAAGDDVVLIKLAQGMEEAARTKTDAQGRFSFNLEDSSRSALGSDHPPERDLPHHGASGYALGGGQSLRCL